MSKDREELAALSMVQESANFVASERPREPLHVVLHEHLDGGAVNRATTLDRLVHASANRHMCAQENFFCHVERKSCPERSRMGRDIPRCCLKGFATRFLDSARNRC